MEEMTNSDFICLLYDYPSTDQEEIFNEATRLYHTFKSKDNSIR